jgi:hypothetical protein
MGEHLIPLQVVHDETGPDFEFDDILSGALDLDAPDVLAPGGEQEVLDLTDLLQHCGRMSFKRRGARVRRWLLGNQEQQTPQQQKRFRVLLAFHLLTWDSLGQLRATWS